jgi:hypothetical protein
MPDAENARRMLANPAVANGKMGPVLAEYLVEYLPFETEPENMMESVRRVLQPGLISDQAKHELWQKAARRNAYLVGFLMALPDQLPLTVAEHKGLGRYRGDLDSIAQGGSSCARLLLRALAAPGQGFLESVETVLKRPATQVVVSVTLDLVASYFRLLRPEGDPDVPIAELILEAERFCAGTDSDAVRCRERVPGLEAEIRAMRVLSGVGYGVLRPALGGTTASGSLMRRKLEPVMTPLRAQLEILRGKK